MAVEESHTICKGPEKEIKNEEIEVLFEYKGFRKACKAPSVPSACVYNSNCVLLGSLKQLCLLLDQKAMSRRALFFSRDGATNGRLL